MPFVLDCSTTMSWIFADKQTEASDASRDRLLQDGALVPSLWPIEVSNVILAATRRGRLDQAEWLQVTGLLQALPINVEPSSTRSIFTSVLPLANQHALSVYDAMYLELALRKQLPLATLDKKLLMAARECSVETLYASSG